MIETPNVPEEAKTKKKRRRNRGKKMSRRRKRRGLDRWFGFFRCNVCRHSWASSQVFTRKDTKKVIWKQRCKDCQGPDAWVKPFNLQPIRCSKCHEAECICKCEDCGKLKYKPRHLRKKDPSSSQDPNVDDGKYCSCKKTGRDPRSAIDPNKPHRRDLCEKCLTGKPCAKPAEED